MRLRTEMQVGVGSLIALQVLTTLGAIGLLARIAPGIGTVLVDNVPSQAAAEEMLVALAQDTPDAAASFRDALARAQGNITEDAERPLLATLAADAELALAGDPSAEARAIDAAAALSRVNREAIATADDRARFLGTTGAWAMVVLGAVGFGVGVIVQRRLRERIELPILRLDDTLRAARRGEQHRRVFGGACPAELARTTENTNWLLAAVFERPQVSDPPDPDDRAATLHLLDRSPVPLVLVGTGGRVVAMNRAAMRAGWDEDPAIARTLADAVASHALLPDGWTATAIPDASLVLCERVVARCTPEPS